MDRKTFGDKSQSVDFGYGDRLFMNHDEMLPIESLWSRLMVYKFK